MNEKLTIDSMAKAFLDWCAEYGASPLQVRALVSQGLPLEKALQFKPRKRNILITMNGRTQPMAAWCEQYGICARTLRNRVEQGCTLEEAFEREKHQRVAKLVQQPDHTITKPFLSWCRDYLAGPLHVRATMSMGHSLLHALKHAPEIKTTPLPMQVDGKIDTFQNLCRHFGKAENTIRRRVEFGLTLDDAFLLPDFRKGEMERLVEVGRANEPRSITQTLPSWCRDYSRPQSEVEQRLSLGMDIELALAPQSAELWGIGGETVRLSDLCGRLGVDPQAVRKRLGEGKGIVEALYETAGRRIKNRLLVNGEALRAARLRSGLTMNQIAERCVRVNGVRMTKYTISNMERGKRLVTPEERAALCAVLGLVSDDL